MIGSGSVSQDTLTHFHPTPHHIIIHMLMDEKIVERFHYHCKENVKNHSTTRSYTGCFPLLFTVRSDGGCTGKDFELNNILRNDATVWCSEAPPPVYLVFESATPVTLTEFVVGVPCHGFTSPAKHVQLFVHKAPCESDNCDLQLLVSVDVQIPMDTGFVKHVFSQPVPDVSSILMVVKASHGDQTTNVDLQYAAFGGYRGAHAFPAAKLT